MDDSVLFMQWALSTLQEQEQNERPPVPAAGNNGSDEDTAIAPLLDLLGHSVSPDCIVPGRPPVIESRRRWAAISWSSGDTNSGWCDGSGAPTPAMEGSPPSLNSVERAAVAPLTGGVGCRTTQPMAMSWDWGFSQSASASPRLSNEAMPINYASATAAASRSSAAPYTRDHTIAERKRREKMSQLLIELSTIIPGLTKCSGGFPDDDQTDKATILGDTVRYVKELQEKLRALEDGRSFSRPVVLAKKPRVATPDEEDAVLPAYYYAPAANDDNAEIDARISGDNVMVKIRCKDAKGVLVRLLSEVEGLHLSIVDTNVMPFLACTLVINIMAKVEDGFDSKPGDIVGRLKSALHQHIW
ncbi:unnamed protein product [Urochloa decumbens]|uniref:BHLH domain-containing protein n=1 Tax=Urochloa decumbens TaxID=240449 RepID=A0ABC9D3N9_9POAL